MKYFECKRPQGDGWCSDNSCPCIQTIIPRGKGYLYIAPDIVAFRRRFPKETTAYAEITRRIEQWRLTNDLYRDANVRIRIGPVLVCEQGAKLRDIDLRTAAADASHWWSTGQVPLRPTPLRDGTIPPEGKDNFTGVQGVTIFGKQQQKKWWQLWK